MRSIRRNNKALKIAVVLTAALLTATILAAVTTTTNQNQNAYPLINAYLQGVPQSPNNVIQPKLNISTSTTLNGGIYIETINVLADNIVINGNGSTIQGSGTLSGYGFNLTDRSNVTIYNVTVTQWRIGFYLESSSNNNLTANTANHNEYGFHLHNSSNKNNLTGNNATNNDYGFHLHDSSNNNNLTGNTANYNEYGVALESSSNNNLTANTANYNDYGFHLHDSSNNNNLTGNNATNSNAYGFYLEDCTGNNILGNIALNSTTGGYGWIDSSNNNFTDSTVAYYLRVNVTDSGGLPFLGAQVQVVSNGTVWYATPHFGESDSPTGVDGLTPWFAVPYQTYLADNTTTNNTNTITVWYSTLWETATFSSNPRTGFDMSTSHTENFTLTSWKASALQTMLPILLLMGTQGGTSPLVYAALGIAGLAAVAAVLFYYFRRRV